MTTPSTYAEVLRRQAARRPDVPAFHFLADGEVHGRIETLTFADLDRQARAIGAALADRGACDRPVLLLYPPGLDFVAAWFGCVYAGAIAVPAYPPDPTRLERTLARLRAITVDAGAAVVATDARIAALQPLAAAQAPELAALDWVTTPEVDPDLAGRWRPPPHDPDRPAMLQFTSGSTGAPRGVVLGHDNLLANERLVRDGYDLDADALAARDGAPGVSWLPLFHDMGLIGHVLQPVRLGVTSVLMSPLAFLQRPLRWLEAIHHFRAHTSGGPCFAYDLCLRHATERDLQQLDLGCWEVAYCGAEPIRAHVMAAFADHFAAAGFRGSALTASYGLAEATLFVTGGAPDRVDRVRHLDADALRRGRVEPCPPRRRAARAVVSCGWPRGASEVRVVADGCAQPDDRLGEVWVSGPTVARGYWRKPDITAATFGAVLDGDPGRTWLRTGDQGLLHDGELFLTGRLKELLVIRGRNHYPADIEATVEACHPAVRRGCCAAFPLTGGGEERLGLALEVDRDVGEIDPAALHDLVRSAVAAEHDLHVHRVALLPRRTIPKTSSGKPQRLACRDALLAGELSELGGGSTPVAAAEPDEPIAVVSMACRLPGGVTDPDAYWDLLTSGRDALTDVPPDRWDIDRWYDPDWEARGKMVSRRGGFLQGLHEFDPVFFEMSLGEAPTVDPQQHLLLETCWEALERAGRTREQLAGSRTGVYVGLCGTEYGYEVMRDEAAINAYSLLGTAHSAIVGRLSYWLDLSGPNFPVDTACSSSLVAVHLACQALRAGECDEAVAAGVNVLLSPAGSVYFSRLGALSPDGVCRPFDAGANGYVRGEGCGAVILKRLADAERDGDEILAVIRGSAVNQDGRSNGFTAPDAGAQQAVLREALARAGLEPGEVDYLEAHATGTAVGDPVELRAVGELMTARRPGDRPLLVGSVKGTIGHLEGAAGIASLIKAVLLAQHDRVVPSLHCERPNPAVDWQTLSLQVARAGDPVTEAARPRTIGVSAFGFSGTNAHVVLQQWPRQDRPEHDTASPDGPFLLPLSARGSEALAAQARILAEHLDRHPDLDLHPLAWSLGHRRSHLGHRRALLAEHGNDVAAMLRQRADQSASVHAARGGRIAFLCTGQGAQYAHMAGGLRDRYPVFRDALKACIDALAPHLDGSLEAVLFPTDGGDRERIHQTGWAQPALFAVEVALARLWRAAGVVPDVVLGHSVGELAAAHIAGVMSLQDAARVVAARGELMQAQPPGAMVSLRASEATVADLLAGQTEVSLAAVNGREQAVISGPAPAVQRFVADAEARGIAATRLQVSHAFHSPMMEPMTAAFGEVCAATAARPPSIPLISNVTGRVEPDRITTAGYWVDHVRAPVRFAASVQTARQLGVTAFVEVGPRPTLCALGAAATTAGDDVTWLPSLVPPTDDRRAFLRAAGDLFARGHDLDWSFLAAPDPGRYVSLPTYPFQRRRFRVPEGGGTVTGGELARQGGRYALSGQPLDLPGEERHHLLTLAPDRPAWLADHVVHARVVVPGALYVASILAVASDRYRCDEATLRHVRFLRPLAVERPTRLHLVLAPEPDGDGVRFSFTSPASDGHATLVTGLLLPGLAGDATPSLASITCDEPLAADTLYERMASIGIELGPTWRWTSSLHTSAEQGAALGSLRPPPQASPDEAPLHPALVYNLFAAGLAGAGAGPAGQTTEPYLPYAIDEVHWYGPSHGPAWSRARLADPAAAGDDPSLVVDLELADERGRPRLTMTGFEARRAPRSLFLRLAGVTPEPSSWVLAWQEEDAEERDAALSGRWAVLGETPLRVPTTRAIEAAGGDVRDERDSGEPLDGVVIALDGGDGGDRALAVAELARQVIARVEAVPGHPRVVWLTRGAQAVRAGDAPSAVDAALWGLVRSWRNERWPAATTLVDLPGDDAGADGLGPLLARPGPEWQLAWREGRVWIPRLQRAPAATEPLDLSGGSVLITGGTGFLGQVVAEQLTRHHGVRHLLLLGRRGAPATPPALLRELQTEGAEVTFIEADVTDPEATRRAAAFLAALPPPRGVIHAAGVLDDALAATLTAEQLRRVMSAKVLGASNLHEATRAMDLVLFASFSSIAAVLGSPGQGAYAAANSYLEALALRRRAAGRPAHALAWGPWAGGGMAARVVDRLTRQGISPLDVDEGAALFSQALSRPVALQLIAGFDIATMARVIPADAAGPPLADLLGRSGQPPPRTSPGAGLPADLDRDHLRQLLQREAAAVLAVADAAEVPLDRSLRELGLDSLMAAELRTRVADALGVDLPLTALFEQPTIDGLLDVLLRAHADPPAAREADTRPDRPRLSSGQRRLLFLDRLGTRPELYHVHMELDARGPASVPALGQALATLIDRHEVLRTCFPQRDGEPVPEVFEPYEPSFEVLDLGDMEPQERERRLDALRHDQVTAPFDLVREPAIRFGLVRLGEGHHRLLITQHHAITDGWSLGLLIRELGTLYAAAAVGEATALPPPRRQFAAAAADEHRSQSSERRARELDWWRRQLADLPTLELPATHSPQGPRTFTGGHVPVDLPDGLLACANDADVTPFAAVAGVFAALLGRVSGSLDVPLGTVHANRPHPDDRDALGFFVNTVVLRLDLGGDPDTNTLLQRASRATIEALEHGAVPFDEVVRAVAPDRRGEGNPLFDACVVQETPLTGIDTPARLRIEPVMHALDGSVPGTAKFDLTLLFEVDRGSIRATLEYADDRFDRATAQRLAGQLAVLARAAVDHPGEPLQQLPLDTPQQREALVRAGRGPAEPRAADRFVHDLFRERAETHPEAPAVEAAGSTLTAAELQGRADQLAHHLGVLGQGHGRRVGLLLDRSPERVVAMLGVLGAGSAFVPLDPDDPPARLAQQVRASALHAVVTCETLRAQLPDDVAVVDLDRDRGDIAVRATRPPPRRGTPDDLAYVVFTSGTTGEPKAVGVPHHALVNYVSWKVGAFPPLDHDRMLHRTPLGFDSAQGELWWALAGGCPLVLAPPGAGRDPERLGEVIRDQGITVCKAVPSLYGALLAIGALEGCTGLRLLFAGGEPLPAATARSLHDLTGATVVNLYGPAEATVSATCGVFDPADRSDPVPIGRPIANVRALVLDGAGGPVPAGVTGELYLGGAGVTRGYLGRRRLTRERFVPSPLDPDDRLYRTGDRVRWRTDGQLAFVGRDDLQVQLRGRRVELQEVEAHIARLPGVTGCVAALRGRDPATASLTAWVQVDDEVGVADLRDALRERLPRPLVPSRFVVVDALPRLTSGKVDRGALPATDSSTAAAAAGNLSSTEQALADIWSEVLQRDGVGPHDDFFDLGGHSLLAVAAMIEVQQRFPGRAALHDLFRHPTLRALARSIEGGLVDDRATVAARMRRDVRLPQDMAPEAAAPADPAAPADVLLTGATGFLGAYLLRDLLESVPGRVTCPVRARNPQEAASRIQQAMTTQELWQDRYAARIAALPGDLVRRRLGIDAETFDDLSRSVDAVVHCGAWVHHAHRYETLRGANVGGTVEVLRLAAAHRRKPVHLVSTQEAAGDAPAHTGYAASKWVAEQVAQRAADRGLPVAVYRPALVLGHSETGCFVAADSWLVLLLQACLRLGSLPDRGLPPMHLVPVDRVSRAIVDAVVAGRTGVFPLTHTHTWDEAMIRRVLQRRGVELREVTWERWQQDLALAAADPAGAALQKLMAVLPRERRGDPHADEPTAFADDLPDPELLLDRTVAWLVRAGALEQGDDP